MGEILKENNTPFIVINLPPASFTEEYRCGRTKSNYRAESFHNELKEFIAKLDVPFFNICDYVDDIHSIKSEIEPKDYDQSHYNKEGYCMAAEILKEAILDEIIEKD